MPAAFILPEAAIASHTAMLGKTGSGKTSTSKLLVEHVVDEGHRVCILDTVKSDWWGITSSASGKSAGLPFTILGGPREHVGLHPDSGKVIGELVASGKLPLSVIDMANFRAGQAQGFFIDFAEALFRKMRGVLYLVVEEAHELAPKERSGIGNENMAIYWAKKLATAGRSKGIRLILATQRVQALHNALLGSCETVVVHRMTAPADQEPVKKWLKGNLDKDQAAAVEAGMASLPTGTAWVCSGEAAFNEKVKFPMFRTFDNSATPKKGSKGHDVITAAVDRDALRDLIGEAVVEIEANDPAKLKARIAGLERQLKAAPAAASPPAVDTQALEAAAFARGDSEGFMRGQRMALRTMRGAVLQAIEGITEADLLHSPPVLPAVVAQPAAAKAKPVATSTAPAAARPAPTSNGSRPPSALRDKILEAMAFWKANGNHQPSRVQVGFAAGYKAQAGVFRAALNAMREAGEIHYEGDEIRMTSVGLSLLPKAGGGSVWDRLAPKLTDLQRRIVEVLPMDGMPRDRTDVGSAIGMSPQAGVFRGALNDLRDMGVIAYDKGEPVSVAPWVWS